MSASTPKLEVVKVVAQRGARLVLDGVSWSLMAGQVLALMGPNGSGKTSALQVLLGLIPAQSGLCLLDGTRVPFGAPQLRRRMGVVFQEPSVDAKLTLWENLRLGAALYGVGEAQLRRRTDGLISAWGLAKRLAEPAAKLSGGLRRRLELLRALAHAPSIIVLDEPTQGLDPVARAALWATLRERIAEENISVIVSTHDAQEAHRADNVLFLDQGQVVAQGSVSELMAYAADDFLVLRGGDPVQLAKDVTQALGLLARVEGEDVLVGAPNGHTLVPRAVEALGMGRLSSLSLRRPTLADVFAKVTRRQVSP